MKWKKLFQNKTLQAGQSMCRDGGVALISVDHRIYTANVTGPDGDIHTVQVQDFGDSLPPSLYCNCAFAEEGIRCAHMAALLYWMEEEREGGKKEQELILSSDAFPATSQKENIEGLPLYRQTYHYFSIATATENYILTKEDVEKAKEMIASKEVLLRSCTTDYTRNHFRYFQPDDETGGLVLTVEGVYKGGNSHVRNAQGGRLLKVALDRKNILSMYCSVMDCPSYDPYSGSWYYRTDTNRPLCSHIIALLMLADAYVAEHPELGDATDMLGESLLQAFSDGETSISRHSLKPVVRLVPRLRLTTRLSESDPEYTNRRFHVKAEPELAVEFKVGTDKLYIVKNLKELHQAVTHRLFLGLGKKNGIQFATETFTEKSQALYDFLDRALREEFFRKDLNDGVSEISVTKELILYGQRLDEFFSIVEGNELELVDKTELPNGKRNVVAKDRELTLSLRAFPHKDKNGKFDGVTLDGTLPQFIQGSEDSYYLSRGFFYRIPKDNAKALAPFIAASDEGMIQILIGRQRLSDFYYHVLPKVSRYVDLSEAQKGVIEQYLPPEASFYFYLDAVEEDVTCAVMAEYDGEKYYLGNQEELLNRENFFRDLNLENRIIATVCSFFPDYDDRKKEFYTGKNEEVIYRILTEGVAQLMELGEVSTTRAFENLSVRTGWNLSVGVSVNANLLQLSVLSQDIPQEELIELLDSYKRKRTFHRLRNGEFLSLTEGDSVAVLEQMMEDLHLSAKEFTKGKMEIPSYRALYLNKMLEEHDEIATDRDRAFKTLVKSFKTLRDADYDVPPSLKPVLRNYQKQGFRWILTLAGYGFHGILADEMGLGKTLEMIAALVYEKQQGNLQRSLVVCPASLVYNWMVELAHFAPELKAEAVDGSKENRREILAKNDQDILVTSYDLLRRDIAEYEDYQFTYQILDEAQYIKNPKSGMSKAVKIIKSTHRFALSGTPIENRLSELWSIFDYLMPGFLYDYETFREDYETPIVAEKDEWVSKRLSAMTSPFILRRKKESVLKDLPEKLEEIRYTNFSSAQRKIYDSQLLRMKKTIEATSGEDFKKNKMKILADITRLRQICCDPTLLFEDYKGESSKKEMLLELIRDAMEDGHKMLVFSQFTSMLEKIGDALHEQGIPFYTITGETKKEKRLALVNAFNTDEVPVFLISLKAGGTGLNLTGADMVIHYDPWWNVAAENQATDRAHRIGQKKKVSVYKLIAKGTIEERILVMQQEKQNLADEILSGEGKSLSSMTKEELLEILG
ncbi:MAG: DEAD/DEAH box helicase [Lachnospiraceae bacterium]|nr:DEAD/DEAH box helicase [Lachnospiraceae bacterium]